jgi:hypothetical protein
MDLLATRAQVFVVNHENIDYRRQLTADEGFFTILVKPPVDWQAVAPVVLAFSLRDLYLLGYQDNADGGRWKLYDDAYLIGSGADDPANANSWEYLNYSGGYTEEMHHVQIGMAPMYFALQTINNPASDDMAVRLALGVYIIIIPEACRFPVWKSYLVGLLRRFETVILIHQEDRFDGYFTKWSSICKRVRQGPARFIPGNGFATYQRLIEVVFVLLSRPPADEL